MNRRFLKSLTFWIVPLLILRALVPSGYMISVGAQGLQVMFCPAVVQAPSDSAPAMDHSAHHASMDHGAMHHASMDQAEGGSGTHTGSHDGHDAASSHVPCPFSLVASAALTDVPFVVAATGVVAERAVQATVSQSLETRLIRADRIRGPPAFS